MMEEGFDVVDGSGGGLGIHFATAVANANRYGYAASHVS